MPVNIEQKLQTFSALVMEDAKEKREEIMERTEKEYNERLNAKENELLEGAYESIQKNIHDAQKDANEQIMHTEFEAKRALIKKREEIIESVMSEVREKLAAFTRSGEYEKWLTEKTEKAFSELGAGAKTVYISPDDFKLKEKIEGLADNVTVEISKERGFLGGIKVTNTERRVAVDYSFKEMLSAGKQKFLRESGLTID